MSEIIAVTSGKGGVGKSTVSAGLGQALSQKGKNVLILELDAGLRGMDIMLGVENLVVYDLGDVFYGNCALEDAIVPIEQFSGLYLLAAASSVSESLEFEKIIEFCSRLKNHYDYIIVDLPAGIAASIALIPSIADLAIVIVTPDYVSIRDSAKMVTLLAEADFQDCKILINKVNTKYRKMNMITDLDQVLDGVGVPLLGVLPEDLQIKTAFSCGMQLDANSAPYIVFDRLAARIEGDYTPLYIE